MKIQGFTADDWDAVPSYMFGDQDRPPVKCGCRGCTSEGFYDQDRTCAHWVECDAESGRHGDRCECREDDGTPLRPA